MVSLSSTGSCHTAGEGKPGAVSSRSPLFHSTPPPATSSVLIALLLKNVNKVTVNGDIKRLFFWWSELHSLILKMWEAQKSVEEKQKIRTQSTRRHRWQVKPAIHPPWRRVHKHAPFTPCLWGRVRRWDEGFSPRPEEMANSIQWEKRLLWEEGRRSAHACLSPYALSLQFWKGARVET